MVILKDFIHRLKVTIQMKAIEQCVTAVLFMLYKVVLTFESVDEILKYIQLHKTVNEV